MENTQLAITNKEIEGLVVQINKKQEKGLKLPQNYSVANALNSAYLMLKEAEDKNNNKLLEVCTQDSVIQSLMQMATQGLNPIKKQCYFVAYGKTCKLVPSYFGTLAILNRVKNLKRQPVANVVYQGDVFEVAIDTMTGEKRIVKHETKLENMDNPIVAAYAIIETDKEYVLEIMTKLQLERAWEQGKSWQAAAKGGYESKTHKNFSEEMAKKTVLNRASKKLINATDDSSVMDDDMLQAYNETSDNDKLDVVAESTAVEIAEQANTEEFVEAPETDVVDGEFKEVSEPHPTVEPPKEEKPTQGKQSSVPDWMNQQ